MKNESERERECVIVHVCERERKRDLVCVCERESEREKESCAMEIY